MNAAQRICMIRTIAKIDGNPEFSKKIGVKNTSEFKAEKSIPKKVTAGRNRQKEISC